MTWCIIDLETENHEYYGSIASPHNPDNYIVASGWCIDGGKVQSEYYHSKEESLASNWLERALDGQQVLVAFNATFEIHWLLHTYPETLMKFFRRGGRVFCPQYAEFLLSHQLDMYPRLEDCAIKYGGTKKIDQVKLLWQQGYKTSEIDQALLMEYLADEHCGDVANTRLVCFKQVAEAKAKGMYLMMQMRMDSLLFNAVSTYNGLKVDMDVAAKNQAEQEQRIQEIRDQIINDLPSDIPEDLQFSFTSPYHMSAFLYGGTIQYDAKVSYEPKKYEQVECNAIRNKNTDELRYVPIGHATAWDTTYEEWVTFKSGKNKGLPKVFKVDSDVEKLKWGKKTFKFKGLIDLEKLPSTARDKFLGKRAEYQSLRGLVCGTPVYSTSGAVLEMLANVVRD